MPVCLILIEVAFEGPLVRNFTGSGEQPTILSCSAELSLGMAARFSQAPDLY